MSYTFSVSYQNIAKKVTCKATASVGQLVALSVEKFKLPSNINGSLSYGGKTLDSLTPLRLTGLVNNARLVLKTSSGSFEMCLRLTGTILGHTVTKVRTIQSDFTISDVVNVYVQSLVDGESLGGLAIDVSVLRYRVTNRQPEYHHTTIGSIVGSSANAVVRITIEETKVQLEKEKRQRKAIEDMNERSNLAAKEAVSTGKVEDPESDISKKESKREHQNQGVKPARGFTSEITQKEEYVKSEEVLFNDVQHSDTSGSESQKYTPKVRETSPEKSTEIRSNSVNTISSTSKSTSMPQTTAFSASWQLPEEKTDTLYVPEGTTTNTYENPDEDYELTSNQAEKYYKILKSMQGKPAAKKTAKKPLKYIIRIRFPDRALLDLHFEDPHTKLGQLLKKLDSYLLEKHINHYHLKNGLPPFEEIQFDFASNNTALCDHAHFQQEKILLIWETQEASKGPYLRPEVQRKDVSELPTVVLEKHRGDLEAEDAPLKSSQFRSDQGLEKDPKGKPRPKGVPKWFRP